MSGVSLPIDAVRSLFERALAKGSVVLSAPTGSGKSTAVPRWCAASGRVLVVEPRRVACRGLADWVAKLEGCRLGEGVGYAVRDDRCFRDASRIVFATPGVVIRWLTRSAPLPFDAVVLDEFHERSLEVDLLLALLQKRFEGRLVVMSATMAAERVAEHLSATHVESEGREFEVAVRYLPGDVLLPSPQGLQARVQAALGRLERLGVSGDILVFLPGKAEIATMRASLALLTEREILVVHGGLPLREQNRVFEAGERPRIILSTNVAETAITIPCIEAVIDAGLVRRTRYANGRGFLTLSPIALDSAAQRAGRAGRVKPGICVRLWSDQAVLSPATQPEMYRESLTPLLLAAAACNERLSDLVFLDPPKAYAVEAAAAELASLRAVDSKGAITERGRVLFGFPLDASLASLLVEAEREGCLRDGVDLVSVLATGRPLFQGGRPPDPERDLRRSGCDAVSLIRALREGDPERHLINPHALAEARATRARLVAGWSLRGADGTAPIDRKALIRAVLRSDPRAAFVARRRRGRTFWAGGGSEIRLARESAVDEEKSEAIAVVATMAIGEGHRKDTIYATAAIPVRFADLAEAGLGEERVVHATREGEVLRAEIRRVFAGQTISVREAVPEGEMARAALLDLLVSRRLFPDAVAAVRETLAEALLAQKLDRLGVGDGLALGFWEGRPVPELAVWLAERINALGVDSGADVALLSAADFALPSLPAETSERLALQYPRLLPLGNVTYEVSYDVSAGEVMLNRVRGNAKQPPSLATLPAFRGFRVKVRHHSKVWVVKERSGRS